VLFHPGFTKDNVYLLVHVHDKGGDVRFCILADFDGYLRGTVYGYLLATDACNAGVL
jgi:hypothetical protein